jgi:hypothetical protein
MTRDDFALVLAPMMIARAMDLCKEMGASLAADSDNRDGICLAVYDWADRLVKARGTL